MPEMTKMYWLHALTPLHIGTGFGIGPIDQPIEREKITNWPVVPGSSVKGVIADFFNAGEPKDRTLEAKTAFGQAGDDHANAGALVFTDARLVCMPVKSDYGTFAWVTSHSVLLRLHRDLKAAGLGDGLAAVPAETELRVPDNPRSQLCDDRKRAYLSADLEFTVTSCPATALWASRIAAWLFPDPKDPWRTEFESRFGILPDELFNSLAETGTEVVARVKIEPARKAVEKGKLWYEEYLPAESVLAGLIWCDGIQSKRADHVDVLRKFCTDAIDIQIGGKATVGKGRARCVFGGK